MSVKESSSSCCIPNNPYSIAAIAFALAMTAAVALTAIHTLHYNPNLEMTYYCVFGTMLAVTGIAFIAAAILACKKSCSSKPTAAK